MPSICKHLNAGSNVLHICGFESYSLTALSKRLYPSFPPLLHESSCSPQQCEKVSSGYHPYTFCQSSKHFVFISNSQIVKMSFFFFIPAIPFFCKFTVQSLPISFLFFFSLFSILIPRTSFIF